MDERAIDHDPIDRSRSRDIIILDKRRRPFDIWQEFVDISQRTLIYRSISTAQVLTEIEW